MELFHPYYNLWLIKILWMHWILHTIKSFNYTLTFDACLFGIGWAVSKSSSNVLFLGILGSICIFVCVHVCMCVSWSKVQLLYTSMRWPGKWVCLHICVRLMGYGIPAHEDQCECECRRTDVVTIFLPYGLICRWFAHLLGPFKPHTDSNKKDEGDVEVWNMEC